MRLKQKLAYMAFGSLFTLIGYLLANTVSNVIAQSDKQSVEFKEIKCRGLSIVDAEGNVQASFVYHKQIGAMLSLQDKEMNNQIIITGNAVRVWKGNTDMAFLGMTEEGGLLELSNNGDKRIGLGCGLEDGNGMIEIWGKGSDTPQVTIRVTEYGGGIVVTGKGNDNPRASMLVDGYGNGSIGLWDKNGYGIK